MGQGLCLPRRGLSAALEWDDLAAEPLPGGPAGTPLRASLRKSKAQLHRLVTMRVGLVPTPRFATSAPHRLPGRPAARGGKYVA